MAPQNNEGGMRDLVGSEGYSFPVLLDRGDIGSDYRIRYVPTTFAIDAEGKITERIVGAVDFTRLSGLADDLTR